MEFIQIESITGNEAPMADAIESWLSFRGWNVFRQPIGPEIGRDNIYARFHETEPDLIFNTHIDTVGPYFPGQMETRDGETIITGRGSCDTKNQIAALLLVGDKLAKQGLSVGFLFTVGEEEDHDGALKTPELGLQPKILVTAEPTKMKLINMTKGYINSTITSKGKPAHSGYPELGEDALLPLLDVLQDLRKQEWPSNEFGRTTMNIGRVDAGIGNNIVPDYARADLAFRTAGSNEEIVQSLEKLCAQNGVELQVNVNALPHRMSTLPGWPTDVGAFMTDIPFIPLAPGGQAFLVGSGTILDAHTPHEKVGMKELQDSLHQFESLTKSILA